MGSKKSSSSSSTTTALTDRRVVAGEGANVLGDGAAMFTSSYEYRDDDVNIDSSDRSTSTYQLDSSNRSTTTTYNTGTDPGVVKLGEINAQMVGALHESNVDGVQALALMGRDVLANAGEAVTDLYATSGQNTARAWELTLDKSADALDRAFIAASESTKMAATLAGSAIASYQPSDNKQADAVKWAALAGVGLVGLLLLRKA